MLEHAIGILASFVVGVISTIGLPGVAALMAMESAGVPLPSEIIMPFAGYLASAGRFDLLLAVTAGAFGCSIGSTIAYAIGLYGGRTAVRRWGRFVLLRREDLVRAERFFVRFGSLAVLIGRLLPVVRTFIAFPAGMARMSQFRFQLYTFVGSWVWCFALATVGYQLGKRWQHAPELRLIMRRLDIAVVVLLVIAVTWFIGRRLRRPPPR